MALLAPRRRKKFGYKLKGELEEYNKIIEQENQDEPDPKKHKKKKKKKKQRNKCSKHR